MCLSNFTYLMKNLTLESIERYGSMSHEFYFQNTADSVF